MVEHLDIDVNLKKGQEEAKLASTAQ